MTDDPATLADVMERVDDIEDRLDTLERRYRGDFVDVDAMREELQAVEEELRESREALARIEAAFNGGGPE